MKNQDTLVMTIIGEHLRMGCHISELLDDYLIRGVMPEDKIKGHIESISDSAKMLYDLCNIYLYKYDVSKTIDESVEIKEDRKDVADDTLKDKEIKSFLKFADALNSSEDRYI